MLGGGFWIAFLRNGIGAALMLAVFLMLDRPRLSMRTTVVCYVLFGFLMVSSFSAWYLLDGGSYVRFSGLLAFPVLGLFCILLSGDGAYLSLYKISLSYYLLSICVFGGVDVSRWMFQGNMWVDIAVRALIFAGILLSVAGRFRRFFFENVDYLREEMDLMSVATLIISFMIAAAVAFMPSERTFSIYSMLRILVIMFMVGLIQYLILHLYIHLGRMHCCQAQNQLLEMNEQFLRRQLELERKAREEAARIRHDMRHHCLLLGEYLKHGDIEGLSEYLKQYSEDVESAEPKHVCANKSVDAILSAYAGHAEQEGIKTVMEAELPERIAVRDIDLVAILANLYENAIHGCLVSGRQEPEIRMGIVQKGHKIVIQCSNTCSDKVQFRRGLPQAARGGSSGISSIVRTADRYHGETDFLVKDGRFTARVLLNLPAQEE